MNKIDDASYQEGRAAFAAGTSIRQIVEQIMASGHAPDDVKAISSALGFADALIDQLRRPLIVSQPNLSPNN